jgi:hypothetical protein
MTAPATVNLWDKSQNPLPGGDQAQYVVSASGPSDAAKGAKTGVDPIPGKGKFLE